MVLLMQNPSALKIFEAFQDVLKHLEERYCVAKAIPTVEHAELIEDIFSTLDRMDDALQPLRLEVTKSSSRIPIEHLRALEETDEKHSLLLDAVHSTRRRMHVKVAHG